MPSITERIKAFNADRDPVMMKSKYKAMMENPFRFFRGSCHIFYEDLAAGNLDITSPAAWICGDLHLENFGSYKSDNRLVYFDMNDFDEAILAPAHWEILRLVTSIFVAFESLEIEKKRAEKLARLYIRVYAETLKSGKAGYIERQTAEGIVSEFLAHAALKKRRQVLDKKTIKTRDRINLAVNIAKHEKLDYKLRKAIKQHMQEWLHHDENSPYNYHVIDCVFRKAGTGSLGLNRYVLLLKSSNKTGSKYILLDMKQVKGSSLAPYVNMPQPEWDPKASRILEIQTRMQNRPPALFSTTTFRDHEYIIQELQPEKDSIDFTLLRERYRDMCRVVSDMAMLTASARIRSSGRQGSATTDELITFGKRDDWQESILEYAAQYGLKVEQDFNDFSRAVKSGEIPVKYKANKNPGKPVARKKNELNLAV